MPAWLVPAIMAGIGALGGSGGGGQQEQSGRSSTQNHSFGTGYRTGGTMATGSQRPIYDDRQNALADDLLGEYMRMLNDDPNLSGYEAQGIRNINAGADLESQNMQEILSSRGIRGPAAGHALAGVQRGRFADTTGFRNSVPLLARQLNQSILGDATNFFRSLPFGTDTASNDYTSENFGNDTRSYDTTQNVGTVNTPGGGLRGGLANLGNILAFFQGQGAFGGGGGNGSAQNFNGPRFA